MTEATALVDAMVTEHAAVYAYGVLGARLDDTLRKAALSAYNAHRARRDALGGVLRARTLTVPAPAASYDVAVAGPAQAIVLAVRVETEVGVRWRDLIAATDDKALRRMAVQALQDCAVRAAQWRRTGGLAPVTVPLPGQV